MEVLFINSKLGYDYQIEDEGKGISIISSEGNLSYFKFREAPFREGPLYKNEKIIAQVSFNSTHFFYVIEQQKQLISVQQKIRDKNHFFDRHIEIYDKHLTINKTGIASMTLYIHEGRKRLLGKRVNGLLSRKQQNEWYTMKLPIKNKKILGSIKYNNKAIFITYYPNKEKLSISKIFLEEIDARFQKVTINNRSNIEFMYENENYNFDFRKVEKDHGIKVRGSKAKLPIGIVLKLKINKTCFYIYSYKGKNYLTCCPKKAYGIKSDLKVSFVKDTVIIYGKYSNTYRQSTGEYDYIYIKGNDKPISSFRRLSTGRGKSFAFAKIPIEFLTDTEEIHRGLYLGNEVEKLYPLYMKNYLKEDFEVFARKKINSNIVIFRGNVGEGTSCTILPFSEEYSLSNILKQNIASLTRKKGDKAPINLYFEKFSKKADESAIKVFDKVLAENTLSKNYFILDKRSKDFPLLKEKYGNKLVKKYSLKHYSLIYNADHFISTEFSNHLINDRIFINKLRSKITKTPLIFLQHGIMFAKPIENPMAAGFHKKNIKINLKKVVISSKLEAKEFYKVGYQPDDLLLSGLATFDYPVINDLKFYSYMPTYRYWEEHLVYENRLEETSYYRDIISVIRAFEENNLLEKLLIVPHNKFADYIVDHFPNYKENICTNPSEALTVSKIFISDYSSAIYDAINRGSYPIFWWKEKDMLIEKYQAQPSLNEDTAPGPIAYTEQELIETVLNAERRGFQLEEAFIDKYKKINNFSDNKNTERIVDYLKTEKII
nr:teichoic acid biosynthesis protein [Lactococcus garvieae]